MQRPEGGLLVIKRGQESIPGELDDPTSSLGHFSGEAPQLARDQVLGLDVTQVLVDRHATDDVADQDRSRHSASTLVALERWRIASTEHNCMYRQSRDAANSA